MNPPFLRTVREHGLWRTDITRKRGEYQGPCPNLIASPVLPQWSLPITEDRQPVAEAGTGTQATFACSPPYLTCPPRSEGPIFQGRAPVLWRLPDQASHPGGLLAVGYWPCGPPHLLPAGTFQINSLLVHRPLALTQV